jgi:hypothetical protein
MILKLYLYIFLVWIENHTKDEFSGWLFGNEEGNEFVLLGTGTNEAAKKLRVSYNAGISQLTT